MHCIINLGKFLYLNISNSFDSKNDTRVFQVKLFCDSKKDNRVFHVINSLSLASYKIF